MIYERPQRHKKTLFAHVVPTYKWRHFHNFLNLRDFLHTQLSISQDDGAVHFVRCHLFHFASFRHDFYCWSFAVI